MTCEKCGSDNVVELPRETYWVHGTEYTEPPAVECRDCGHMKVG